jgi:hypothetical protein
MNDKEGIVSIPLGLFSEIEAYLEKQLDGKDGEAARLLMALEDLEIDRVSREIFPDEGQN